MGASAEQFPVVANRTRQEIEEIKSIKPPAYTPAYPLYTNPNAVKADAGALAWFDQQRLASAFTDPKELQSFQQCNFHELAFTTFVDCGEEELLWTCNFNSWLWVLDDLLDSSSYFSFPEKSASLFKELNLVMMWSFPDDIRLRQNFVELLNLSSADEEHRQATLQYVDSKLAEARLHPGTVYDISGLRRLGPLLTSFGDLWAGLVASTPAVSVIRWAVTLQQYIIGNVQEVRNRQHRSIPSIPEYIAIRRKSSAVDPCVVIVEYTDKVSLPDDVFDNPEMKALLDAINDVVSWHNDIWSFKKEILQGDVHNLIFVISHERGCSFADAAAIALDMLHARLQDLAQAMQDLEDRAPPEHQLAVSRYIKLAKCWVSGTHDFTVRSKRYL